MARLDFVGIRRNSWRSPQRSMHGCSRVAAKMAKIIFSLGKISFSIATRATRRFLRKQNFSFFPYENDGSHGSQHRMAFRYPEQPFVPAQDRSKAQTTFQTSVLNESLDIESSTLHGTKFSLSPLSPLLPFSPYPPTPTHPRSDLTELHRKINKG